MFINCNFKENLSLHKKKNRKRTKIEYEIKNV